MSYKNQTPTQSLIKVYLSEDEEDKRRMNSKEMEEADDMMPMMMPYNFNMIHLY